MEFQKFPSHVFRNEKFGGHAIIERSKVEANVNARNKFEPISMVKKKSAKISNRVGAIASAVAQTYMAIVLVEYSSLALEGIRTSAYLNNITFSLVLYGEHHRILRCTVGAYLDIIST